MLDLHDLTHIELDALREVASIGAAHAATALSAMTASTIMINVPRISIARTEEIPGHLASGSEPVAIVHMHLLGDLTGRTFLIFPRSVAVRLAELMLRRPPGSARGLGRLEESAIMEAGNILGGAYMNALSDFLHVTLLPSPPSLTVDASPTVVAQSPILGGMRDFVFAVETQFYLQEHGERLRGFFLLLPDVPSLERMLDSLRVG